MASQLQQNLIEIKNKLQEAGIYINAIIEHTDISSSENNIEEE